MAFKHQVMAAEEGTYGTFQTPDRSYEVLPGETLGLAKTAINSEGLRPGRRYADGTQRVVTRRDAGGRINFEVATTGFGLWFKHMFGTVNTVLQGTGAYEHTFTPGDLSGLSLTIQKGIERTDGTVEPFAVTGAKIPEWELSVNADEILRLGLTVDGRDIDQASPLAVWAGPALKLYSYAHGSIEIDDSPVGVVKQASIRGTNALNVDRRFFGDGQLKSEPRENDFRSLAGNLRVEFDDPATVYDAFVADTSKKFELVFIRDEIEPGFNEEIHITVNDIRFQGDVPKIDSPDVPDLDVPWDAFRPAAGDVISLLYRTPDATP